jgi:hypothetical protein
MLNMMKKQKKETKPKAPLGYRWVLRGEVLRKGDKWFNTDTGSWEETRCYPARMSESYREDGNFEYIRRVELSPTPKAGTHNFLGKVW